MKELLVLKLDARPTSVAGRSVTEKANFPTTCFKKDMTFSAQLDHWFNYFCCNKEFSETKPWLLWTEYCLR